MRIWRKNILRLILLVCLLLSGLSVSAQRRQITGVVQSVDGALPWQITLTLTPINTTSGVSQTIEVAEDGRFQFDEAPDGQYQISLSQNSGYVWTDETARLLHSRRWRPGDYAELKIVKGGVITGVVTEPTGEPAVGVKVRAFPTRLQSGNGLDVRSIKTDDRGQYRIYGLEAGDYVVAAFPDQPGMSPSYHPSGAREAASEIEVSLGFVREGIDIRMHHQLGWSVSGKISTPQSGFVSTVRLLTANGSFEVAQVQANYNGYFSLPGIIEGNYLLLAEEKLRASSPQPVIVDNGDLTGLKLTMIPLIEAAGHVSFPTLPNSCKGFAIKPEEVRLRMQHNAPPAGSRFVEAEAVSGKTGAFSFSPLLPGTYHMTASAGVYGCARQIKAGQKTFSLNSIPLSASDNEQLGLTLDYGGMVNGRVSANSQVWFFTPQGQFITVSQADQEGKFKTDPILAGDYFALITSRAIKQIETPALFQQQRGSMQTINVRPCQITAKQ